MGITEKSEKLIFFFRDLKKKKEKSYLQIAFMKEDWVFPPLILVSQSAFGCLTKPIYSPCVPSPSTVNFMFHFVIYKL